MWTIARRGASARPARALPCRRAAARRDGHHDPAIVTGAS